MKKLFFLLAAVAMLPLAGCGNTEPPAPEGPWDEPLVQGETPIEDIKVGTVGLAATVTVRGTVTATAGNSFYIQRHDEAIYVYGYQPAEGAYVPAIGNYVSVTGTVDEYNGLLQIADATEVTKVQDQGETITPLALTSLTQVSARHSGRIVSFEDASFYHGTVTVGTNSNVEVTIGGSRVTLRTDRYASEEAQQGFATALNNLNYLDLVDFTGPLGWYNGAQFALVDGTTLTSEANAGAFDPNDTNNQALALNALTYDFMTEAQISQKTDLTDFSFGYDVVYTAEIVTPEGAFADVISIENNTTLVIDSPTSEEWDEYETETGTTLAAIIGRITAQLTYEGQNYGSTKSFNVQISSFDPQYMTIEDAIERDETGKLVHGGEDGVIIRGYVTKIFSSDLNGATIQDGEFAIFLYHIEDYDWLQVGDLVEATGELTEYNGAHQLNFIDNIEIVEDEMIDEPVVLNITTADEWNAKTMMDIHRIVNLEMVYVSGEVAASGHSTLKVTVYGVDANLYINYHVGTSIQSTFRTLFENAEAGDTFVYTGTIGYYNDYQLVPYEAADIVAK